MQSEVNKAIGALTMGIRIEQNGHRFYLRAAEETDDPEAQELFRGLAADEVAHEEILRRRLQGLQQEGTWSSVGEAEWPAEPPQEGAEGIFALEHLGEGASDYTSELSALRMGYLIEKNAVAFYTKAARETDDAVGKAMYEDLADWERGHQRILEREYRFLMERFKLDMGFAPF